MRLNGLRCDNCTKEHVCSHDIMGLSTQELLPEGWFMVGCGPYRRGNETPVFCSARCLKDWAEKQCRGLLEVNEEASGRNSIPLNDYSSEKDWEENTRELASYGFFNSSHPVDHEKMAQLVETMHPRPRVSDVRER